MTLRTGLQALTALGAATMGGVFFAFSAFVMPALGRLPPAQAVAAMQSINVTAVRPALMSVLFGTALGCVALAIWAIAGPENVPTRPLLIGAALYLVGVVGLTAGYHVPRNDSLALLDPGSAAAAAEWKVYLAGWTAANHVRALAALASAAAFMVSLR